MNDEHDPVERNEETALTVVSPVVEPEAPVVDRQPVEFWALKNGHCSFRAGAHSTRVATLNPHESDHFITDLWKFRGAQFHFRWETGQALTETEYLDAIKTVENI